jgi:replicative DNA helicase
MTPCRHEQALTKIALCIRDCPDTGGGVQLRRFLWSLYNQHHLVNLWTVVSRLDGERSALVSEVLTAALVGNLKEDHIKRALLVAGEMARWDETLPSNETQRCLEEAESKVASLVRSLPPCRAHTDLVSLLRQFAEVRNEWRMASQAEPGR